METKINNSAVGTEETKINWTPDKKHVDTVDKTNLKNTAVKDVSNEKAANAGNTKKANATTPKNTTSTKKEKGEWAKHLPENEKLNAGDILYLLPDKKFGEFLHYGNKEGRGWTQMWKKNTLIKMSREWALKLEETEIAFKKVGDQYVNQNPAKFVMIDKIPMLLEDVKKDETLSKKLNENSANEAAADKNAAV